MDEQMLYKWSSGYRFFEIFKVSQSLEGFKATSWQGHITVKVQHELLGQPCKELYTYTKLGMSIYKMRLFERPIK